LGYNPFKYEFPLCYIINIELGNMHLTL